MGPTATIQDVLFDAREGMRQNPQRTDVFDFFVTTWMPQTDAMRRAADIIRRDSAIAVAHREELRTDLYFVRERGMTKDVAARGDAVFRTVDGRLVPWLQQVGTPPTIVGWGWLQRAVCTTVGLKCLSEQLCVWCGTRGAHVTRKCTVCGCAAACDGACACATMTQRGSDVIVCGGCNTLFAAVRALKTAVMRSFDVPAFLEKCCEAIGVDAPTCVDITRMAYVPLKIGLSGGLVPDVWPPSSHSCSDSMTPIESTNPLFLRFTRGWIRRIFAGGTGCKAVDDYHFMFPGGFGMLMAHPMRSGGGMILIDRFLKCYHFTADRMLAGARTWAQAAVVFRVDTHASLGCRTCVHPMN